MTTESLSHEAAHERIKAVLTHHLGRLEELARLVLDAVAELDDPAASLPESALVPVRDRLVTWLGAPEAAFGYGFVAAPTVVEGRERYLYWFQRGERGVHRLQLNFDSGDVNVYDYLAMDWYTKAEDTRRQVIYGPYVDYTGSDQFVMTLSHPVVHRGRFLGVAGADLLMTRMEVELVPVLNQVRTETVVVNADRQVVMSNSARWITGDRLRTHPLRDGAAFAAVSEIVEGTGWAVASGPVGTA